MADLPAVEMAGSDSREPSGMDFSGRTKAAFVEVKDGIWHGWLEGPQGLALSDLVELHGVYGMLDRRVKQKGVSYRRNSEFTTPGKGKQKALISDVLGFDDDCSASLRQASQEVEPLSPVSTYGNVSVGDKVMGQMRLACKGGGAGPQGYSGTVRAVQDGGNKFQVHCKGGELVVASPEELEPAAEIRKGAVVNFRCRGETGANCTR